MSLEMDSNTESTALIEGGERAMRQCVWVIFECAPFRNRRCFMWGGRGGVPQRITDKGKLCLCPVKVCLGGEGRRKERA